VWLLVVFVVVPAAELWAIFQVGARFGLLPTLGLLLFTALAGATLARAEGLAVVQRIQQALREGRMPTAELVDGLLILFAAALLLAPGFLTDVVGLLVLFPLTRPLFRRLVGRWLRGRMVIRRPPPGDPGDDPGGPWLGPGD